MKGKLFFIIALVGIVFLLPCQLWAQESASGLVDEKEQVTLSLTVQHQKILDIENQAMQKIEELQLELLNCKDPDRIPELNKEIEKIHKESEIQVLEVKLEIAKQEGDPLKVAEISQALDIIKNPEKYVKETAEMVTDRPEVEEEDASK